MVYNNYNVFDEFIIILLFILRRIRKCEGDKRQMKIRSKRAVYAGLTVVAVMAGAAIIAGITNTKHK